LDGSFLAHIPSNDLIDFVHFDGTDEERLTALDVLCESVGLGPTGEVLDPSAGVDEDQKRSFFSRRPFGFTPRAIPR
jgi:hypothetical protein